jgi:cephalosporin-C deacetylase-like acetyl esterase
MLNRRHFLLASGAMGVLQAQTPDLADMLLNYFAQRLDTERPKTPPGVEAIREKLRQISGPYPQRTPLTPRIAKTTSREGYRIESLLFQSRPDFWVTGNLYVPTNLSAPAPAIVMQRGHFDPDRMAGDYQQICFDFVKAGFFVLSFDPIGQGPRRQRWTEPGAEFDSLLSTSLEHALIGNKLALLGESSVGWFTWDAMSAVDYLLTRSDVDPKRIGYADHSDNGAESSLFCALDDRIVCAALHAARFGHRWPVDPTTWIVLDDAQEYLPGAATYGIDICETFASLLPRPLLILMENPDGGFNAAADHLRARYRQAGQPAKFAVAAADASSSTDNWPKRLRLETVAWFIRWFETGSPPSTETDVIPATGLHEPCPGKSIYTLIREQAQSLPPDINSMARLRQIIRPLNAKRQTPAILNSETADGMRVDHLQLPSEPGIVLPAQLRHPAKPNGKVVLYVSGDVTVLDPSGGDNDPEPPPPDATAQHLAATGYTVLSVDVRGIGVTAPRIPRRGFRVPYHHLLNRDMAFNMMAWSLGDSLLAMRVRDVLQAVNLAATIGEVWLAGKDMGAVWAIFAAALDPRVKGVITQNGLVSWKNLLDHDRYHQASSQFHWGILKDFDIPQVAALIAPRRLTILSPLPPEDIETAWALTRTAYRQAGAPDLLRIRLSGEIVEAL